MSGVMRLHNVRVASVIARVGRGVASVGRAALLRTRRAAAEAAQYIRSTYGVYRITYY